MVDHGQQLAVQGVQVDLVAEAAAERLNCAGGVVAAVVEAAVDQRLHPRRNGWNRAAAAKVAAAITSGVAVAKSMRRPALYWRRRWATWKFCSKWWRRGK